MSYKNASKEYPTYDIYKKEMILSRRDEIKHLLPGFYVICEGVKILTGNRASQ